MKCCVVFQGFFIMKIITFYGARRLALSAKCLLHKHQNLSPAPSTKQGTAGNHSAWVASPSNLLDEFQARESFCLKTQAEQPLET